MIIYQLIDPNINYFEKKSEEKRERIAKNEFQRLRNISRSQKMKIAGNSGVVPQLNQSKEQLKKASVLAKQSTASVGRFAESLAEEKAPKNSGKKRKFEPNFGDINKEKDKSLKIIDEIMNKKPKLDINKAIEPMVKNNKKSVNYLIYILFIFNFIYLFLRNESNKTKSDFKRKNKSKFDKKGKNNDRNKKQFKPMNKSNKFNKNRKK